MPVPRNLRLKHQGTGNPNQYQQPTYRAVEGRPFPTDFHYGYAAPPQLRFGTGGQLNGITYMFRCEADQAKRMIPHILGFGSNAGNGPFKRTLPCADPDDYGMVAVDARFVYECESGFNPLTGRIDLNFEDNSTEFDPTQADEESTKKYRYGVLTVECAHLPYHILPDNLINDERDRYMSTLETASSEYVQLDSAVIFWKDGPQAGKAVATGAGLPRAVSEIVVTWARIPHDAIAALIANWRPLLTTVNLTDLTLPYFNVSIVYPPGTMNFQPWRLRDKPGPLGNPEYEVDLRWLYRNNGVVGNPKGWNFFLYPPDGSYNEVTWGTGGGALPIFPKVDHDKFFKAV